MFKSIINYENYAVNAQGVIINQLTNKVLKPSRTAHGYYTVTLYPRKVEGKKHKSKKFRVHRLVAELFLPKVKGKKDVNHLDGNKENNCVQNLEWVNFLENNAHARDILNNQTYRGTRYSGQHHSKAKHFRVTNQGGETVDVYGFSQLGLLTGYHASYLCKQLKKTNVVHGFTIVESTPPSDAVKNLTKHLVVRLTEQEDSALNKLAEAKKKPKSYFLRLLIIDLLEKENFL